LPEGKKTDVNIAVNLLEDNFRGLTNGIVIVSGDSDLEPAAEWLRRNHPHLNSTIHIPTPEEGRHQRRNANCHRMASPASRSP